MGAHPRWRRSMPRRIILFLGSIRFAIPVLALSALALICGTWIEATRGADDAGRLVYGAWWFIALMALICLILVLAVVTRYPWRKKHTGFIIVHGALILIIASAFLSYFTKVEGEIALREGTAAREIRTGKAQLLLLEHGEKGPAPIDSVVLGSADRVSFTQAQFEILERWDNSRLEVKVFDDGHNPLHAVQISIGDAEEYWVAQLDPSQPAHTLAGVDIRVMPEGQAWTPPGLDGSVTLELVIANASHRADAILPGATLANGWRIERVDTFQHAMVGESGLIEGDTSRDNPAVQVTLKHEDGSLERHTAFERFPGSINKRSIAGDSVSGYTLTYQGAAIERPTLVFTRASGVTTAHTATPDGDHRAYPLEGQAPWTLRLGDREIKVHRAFGHARAAQVRVQAPKAEESVPALVVRAIGDRDEPAAAMTLAWGEPAFFQLAGRTLGLVYAPQTRPLPFEIDLVDFRKRDYPGSDQAMAYESDVVFTDETGSSREQTIWMNHPLEHNGWKVYQAGFVGDDVSIFQVTRDPGLIPMYIGCALLCAGILVMHYSRAYAHGHPGMPRAPRARRKVATHEDPAANRSVSPLLADDLAACPDGQREPHKPRELEVTLRLDPDPRPRANHAHGHLRAARGGRSDRTRALG